MLVDMILSNTTHTMSLITQKDFETKGGQEKIVHAIHTLEQRVYELDQKYVDLAQKESMLERDMNGYSLHDR